MAKMQNGTMASLDRYDFEARTKRLMRKHSTMASGYRTKVRSDGLVVVQPKKSRFPVSLRSLVLFLAAFFVFKGFLVANLGVAAYDERVAKLSEGTFVEQAGAYVMWADPLTAMIAEKIGPVLR